MASNDTAEYPVSRETLYDLTWSHPMTSIAHSFDVFSNYLARITTTTSLRQTNA